MHARIHRHLLLFAALVLAVPCSAELPTLNVDKIRDDSSGGSFTVAQTVVLEGRKTFLKSIRGSQRGTRYACFESDILARDIFDELGIRCPRSRMIRIEATRETTRMVGNVVLAMEFVDTRFAGGPVFIGFWPGARDAAVDEFLRVALVDLIIGNADRRDANFFVFVPYKAWDGKKGKPGSYRPIPIDNNCGFGTMVNWKVPTSQTNFFPSYDGLGSAEFFKDLGTIRNIAMDSPVLTFTLGDAALRPRMLELARQLPVQLTDAFMQKAVAALPREIIPHGVKVDPTEFASRLPKDVPAEMLYGSVTRPLSGQELFEHRKQELLRVFSWRRDHLFEALEKYFGENPPTPRD